jgi:GH15 family glucan-1,4-alpha-glucosidase
MALRIEDYAMIGDCRTAALVGRDGSIDWFCAPRFDSGACFAALLGKPENGRYRISPACEVRRVRRRYRLGTLVLETEFETDSGTVRLVDAMALRTESPRILRMVEGMRGEVPIRLELVIRFDYGAIVPWVQRNDGGISAIAGPDKLQFRSAVATRGEDMTTVAEFTVAEGQSFAFDLAWHPSHEPPPAEIDVAATIQETEQRWCDWSHSCGSQGKYREAVIRSLITLKALTYAPTGGIAAAATTSLPEWPGGVRNWDYRYCWLRDATFTLYSLMGAGFLDEAREWREWLLRAVAGTPSSLQIMYGLGGERRLTELELPWLAGYEGSKPVRIGNAASDQFQLDVYGEVFDAFFVARRSGLAPSNDGWRMGLKILDYLESAWSKPDEGIWEVRSGRRHFTHSKVMAWVAFDRAIRSIEQFGLDGPIDRWRAVRDAIHDQTCREGVHSGRGAFVQSFGSNELDASLLMIPLVGFLPPDDPRVLGTVAAIERELIVDGFVRRYATETVVDGLPPGEGAFLPCTFWYADNLAIQGRRDEALALFDRLLDIRNDVGLLAEEYDPHAKRQLGNFPQAFSHVSLVNTAHNLGQDRGCPAEDRPQG